MVDDISACQMLLLVELSHIVPSTLKHKATLTVEKQTLASPARALLRDCEQQ